MSEIQEVKLSTRFKKYLTVHEIRELRDSLKEVTGENVIINKDLIIKIIDATESLYEENMSRVDIEKTFLEE